MERPWYALRFYVFYRPDYYDVIRKVSQNQLSQTSSCYIPTEQKCRLSFTKRPEIFYVNQYLLKDHNLKIIFLVLLGIFRTLLTSSSKVNQKLLL